MGVLCPLISYSKYPIVRLIEIPTYVIYEKQIKVMLCIHYLTRNILEQKDIIFKDFWNESKLVST